MKRIIALILVAVVLASVTGAASYVYLQNAEQHVLSGLDTVAVLETKADIPAGTTFSDAMNSGLIGPADVPSKFSSTSMLTPSTSVTGTLLAGRDLPAGRLLFSGDFVETVESAKVLPVPDGYVAMSFPLAAANRLAPFLGAGDHVAILDGATGAAGGPDVVFDDVLVLGVGNTTNIGSGTGEGADGLITVAVPPSSATTLLRAINHGALYLAMLSTKAS